MYTNAQTIYEGFFKKFPDGPPEDLNEFYIKSGYRYAQMLLLLGRDTAALDAVSCRPEGQEYGAEVSSASSRPRWRN